jgi:hypothetical protein
VLAKNHKVRWWTGGTLFAVMHHSLHCMPPSADAPLASVHTACWHARQRHHMEKIATLRTRFNMRGVPNMPPLLRMRGMLLSQWSIDNLSTVAA